MRIARGIGLGLAVAALTFCAGMFMADFQRGLTYYPSRDSEDALLRAAAGAGFAPWRNAAGVRIGWRSLSGEHARPILVLHGNAGHALHRSWFAQRFAEADPGGRWMVHVLEYPGYGSRRGSPSEQTLREAAIEAIDTLEAPVVLLGESIGTGVAAQAAAARPGRVRGVVMLTPFDSLVSVAAAHFPFLPVQWLMADRYDSISALAGLEAPVAFIIAEDDEVTPSRLGERLFDAYGGPKDRWIARGARHNDAAALLADGEWRAALRFASGESPQAPPP